MPLPFGELPLHRCRTAVSWRKDTPSITHLDRRHAVGRTHEIAQNGEHRHLIRRAIGQRYRYELRSLSSAQAEVDPQRKTMLVAMP